MQIGPYKFINNLVLAPMAGVTDSPFRSLCRKLGAGFTVSEMVSVNPCLRQSNKTRKRLDFFSDESPRVVQIVGADPYMMADAARYNVDQGADIIDINMGCPAKKVCRTMAGSALLGNVSLVKEILNSVINAVNVPVTLKIRTGLDKKCKNALEIARIAEDSGIQALTIHGRTRACGFRGEAEHQTTAIVKSELSIPVIANGDIKTPTQAKKILSITGADGIMLGRAAQGNPWLFREIQHFLVNGESLPPPTNEEIKHTLLTHLQSLYAFYGENVGVKIARKHIGWYCKHRNNTKMFRSHVNRAENAKLQYEMVKRFFDSEKILEIAA